MLEELHLQQQCQLQQQHEEDKSANNYMQPTHPGKEGMISCTYHPGALYLYPSSLNSNTCKHPHPDYTDTESAESCSEIMEG